MQNILKNVQGNVQFEHVQFGYYEENLMKDLNVNVKVVKW